MTFIQQGGRNRHDHICEALELFGSEVMHEFKAEEEAREARKREELAPYLEKAMERKRRMPELSDDEIPSYEALGRQIVAATDEQKEMLEKLKQVASVVAEDPGD